LRHALLQSAPVFKIVGNHPTTKTDPEVVNFLMHYGDLYLGKTTVLCKDTPAFIGKSRRHLWFAQGNYAMRKFDLNVDETDRLTGPVHRAAQVGHIQDFRCGRTGHAGEGFEQPLRPDW